MRTESQIKEQLKNQQQQPQMNIDLSKATPLKCESKIVDLQRGIERNCGGEIFSSGVELKRLSALVSPNGQVSVVPIQIFYCVKCNSRFDIEDIE
tara:strand:- start:1485 stop:1769 length:285 start_codon:yes stop_codon:yes gene_type:complete